MAHMRSARSLLWIWFLLQPSESNGPCVRQGSRSQAKNCSVTYGEFPKIWGPLGPLLGVLMITIIGLFLCVGASFFL